MVVGHPAIRDRDFSYMRETCSGIGAVSTGPSKCGVVTSVYNDINMPYCNWLKQHGKSRWFMGTVNDIRVVKEMCLSPGMFLSSGIACQPFSGLGDGRQQHDVQSESFRGTMKAAWVPHAVPGVLA